MSSPPASGAGSRRLRSRIVIDVDQARQQSSEKGGRGGRSWRGGVRRVLSIIALIVGAALLMLIAGGYMWWQNYRERPAYSLALLIDAAQRDDMPSVEQFIDSDRIAEGLIPQVTGKLVAGGAAAGGGGDMVRRQIEAMMARLLPRVKETVHDEVARAVKTLAVQTGGRVPFPLLALAVPRAFDIREEGERAVASLRATNRDTELTMGRAASGRWKLIGIRDDALAASIARRIAAAARALPGQSGVEPQANDAQRRGAMRTPPFAPPVTSGGGLNR